MTKDADRKRSGIWFRVLWISIAAAALLIAAVCIPAFMLFDNEPMSLERQAVSPRISLAVMQKGQRNLEGMRNANPMTVSRTGYSEDEFNFIIGTMILYNGFQQGGNAVRGVSPDRTSLTVRDGVFHLRHILETKGNPFGRYMNIRMEFELSVKDGVDTFRVISAKAGSLNIPRSRVERELSDLLARYYRGTAQEDLIRNSVLDFHADKDGIHLEYKPYTLLHDIDKIYFGGSGEFLRRMGHEPQRK